MFDRKSDYALNKHSQNIVYRLADGSTVEITPEDCADFERWKALSDDDFRVQDQQDRQASRSRVSFNDLTDTNTSAPVAADDLIGSDESAPDVRTLENAMAILEQCLTETQRRRYLLYIRDGKTTRQIAQIEGVSQRAIMVSLQESERKLKNKLKKGEKHLLKAPKK